MDAADGVAKEIAPGDRGAVSDAVDESMPSTPPREELSGYVPRTMPSTPPREERSGYDTPPVPRTPEQLRAQAAKQDRDALLSARKLRREDLKRVREAQWELFETEREKSRRDQVSYLIKQTDIYSHFMRARQGSEKRVAVTPGGTSKPTRMQRDFSTEQIEDEAMLESEVKGSQVAESLYLPTDEDPPFVENGSPRKYQLEGINWLLQLYANGLNGILADEMGLGKTLETISLLGYLQHYRGVEGPHLVIAPKSTLSNWMTEIQRWVPTLSAVQFHGNKEERAEMLDEYFGFTRSGGAAPFNICVTSYEIAMREKSQLRRVHWRYLIVDEAHRIKNEKSCLSQIIRLFNTQFRLLLTGTPLQNNLHELWALLNFLMPEVFDSAQRFDEWFHLDSEKSSEMQAEIVQQLHKVLRPFLLRRLKTDVERSIPPKKEVMLYVGLSKMQRGLYRSLLMHDIDAVNGRVTGQSRMRLLNILMQLRKCCNHPYLFEGQEPGPPYDMELLVRSAGKLSLLDKLLPHLRQQDSRVLVFSQMTRLLDILEDYCLYRGHSYCRIDGSTSAMDRQERIESFNAPGSQVFVFLLSTRAGGLGINLASADTVILYDSDWNPQVDLQAQDRAHRIGQTKPVTVYRLVTQGSVEEKIIERASRKLFLDRLVIQEGRLVDQNPALRKEELLEIIKFGAEKVFHAKEEAQEVELEAIESIIAAGKAQTQELFDKFKEKSRAAFELKLDGTEALMDLPTEQRNGEGIFGGDALSALAFVEPGPRERKVVGYSVDAYYREVLHAGQPDDRKPRAPRMPREPQRFDFQFYPPRLHELLEKQEANWLVAHQSGLSGAASAASRSAAPSVAPSTAVSAAPSAPASAPQTPTTAQTPRSGVSSPAASAAAGEPESPDGAGGAGEGSGDAEGKGDEEEPSGPAAPVERWERDGKRIYLPPEEFEEKEALSEHGFGNWARRDFVAFCKACERYGREAFAEIAGDIEGKTEADVREYAAVFWERGPSELNEWDRILGVIERGAVRLARRTAISGCIAAWVAESGGSVEAARASGRVPPAGAGQRAVYTEDEDRWLLASAHAAGYGNWEGVRRAIRDAPALRFDWFVKSRTSVELGRRVDVLVRLLEKEAAERVEAARAEAAAARAAAREERRREREAVLAAARKALAKRSKKDASAKLRGGRGRGGARGGPARIAAAEQSKRGGSARGVRGKHGRGGSGTSGALGGGRGGASRAGGGAGRRARGTAPSSSSKKASVRRSASDAGLEQGGVDSKRRRAV